MTWPPAASMRAAAAITSITMNGGTSLRADGEIRQRFADSSMEPGYVQSPAPLLPHSAVSVPARGDDSPALAGYQLAGFGATVAVKGHILRKRCTAGADVNIWRQFGGCL